MTDSFPITLAFPPQGHFTQPYLALPCIQAWLKQQGFDDVELRDLSIEAYDHFLSKPQLERAARLVEERLPLSSFESEGALPFQRMDAFRAAAESAVSAQAVIDRIENAKRVVRSERAFEMDAYVPAVRTLYHGLRLVSAAHFPSKLTPHNFTMGYANDRSAEVLAATLDEQQNPFIDFFRERVLPGLTARKPRVLGLSVIYGSQLIPALTLGRMVKEALPDCHITAGGGFLAYIGEKLMNAPGIDVCIDSIIFHEGEAPMEALCKALRDETDLHDVGSLMWIDRSGDAPISVRNIGMHPIKLDDAPVPDFTGIPFELYFSPETVIPYDINRGCYYGECAFCTLPTVIGPGYRTRSAKSIVDHVLALKERTGARNVNFITDCMPPGMIRDLPQELIDRDADIAWWCDARVEPKAYDEEGAKLLYESGCRKLLFGFETATPRLLKMMKKGQSLKSTVDVATNCANAGISVTFYAMVGFPTETRAEARATLDFLREHAGIVREVSLQTFHIDEVALTYREPELFGIEILDDPEADLQLYHDYVAKEGMTQEEAAEMFEEMMQGFAEFLPLFTGDTILYFMQKSHYFLHLARGATPESFEAECRARTAARESRGATPELAVGDGLQLRELPYGYNEVRRTLATPLARAVRPDFLTGRFDAHAAETAAARLAPIPPRRRVLAYDGDAAEFCELTPDGARALDAIRDAGSLGALIESIDPALDANGAARAKLEGFAAELHRLGLLAPRDRAALVQG